MRYSTLHPDPTRYPCIPVTCPHYTRIPVAPGPRYTQIPTTPCPLPCTAHPEPLAVGGESDLLQPGLHLQRLPVGDVGGESPRDVLSHQAQGLLGQRGGGGVARVAHDPLQALRCSHLMEDLEQARRVQTAPSPYPLQRWTPTPSHTLRPRQPTLQTPHPTDMDPTQPDT